MTNDFLHRFVRALDVGEQRICEQHLKQTQGPVGKYRRQMFHTLLKQKEYDRDGLLLAIGSKWSESRLAHEKHRIYDELIEVVGRLHRERERRQCPWTQWQDARTLMRMGLIEEAAETAQRGIASAIELEDVFAELLLREQLRLIYKISDRKTLQQQIIDNDQRLETSGTKTTDLIAYTLISDRMLDYMKKYRVVDSGLESDVITELSERPELKSLDRATSLPANLHYHFIRAAKAAMENDTEGSIVSHNAIVRLWESNEQRIAQQPHLYRKAIANLIGMLIVNRNYGRVQELLARMEHIPVIYQRDRAMHFCDVELQHQFFYLNTGRLDEALKRAPGIVKGLKDHGKMIGDDYHVVFRYNMGVAHLLNDELGNAKRLFNQVRDLKCPARQDLQGLARLFRLVLLMEDEGFENYLRNSKPFFAKGDRQYSMEKVMYAWIADHWKLVDADEVKQSFGQLAKELKQLEQQKITGAEEFWMWAEANATGRSIRDVYLAQIAALSKAEGSGAEV